MSKQMTFEEQVKFLDEKEKQYKEAGYSDYIERANADLDVERFGSSSYYEELKRKQDEELEW